MIRYKLIDILDNEYGLDDKTFKMIDDSLTTEADIIQRSFRAGGVFVGQQRDTTKNITFIYDVNEPTDILFRQKLNRLLLEFRKTVKIKDTILNIEVDAIQTDHQISYDEGGYFRGARCSVTFEFTSPYWRDVDYEVVTDTGFTSGSISITNDGYIDTPLYITLTALDACNKYSLRVRETGQGILVRDLQFGISGLNTYIIDTKEGTIELNGISRADKIKAGTGFFNLQVGYNTIDILSTAPLLVEVKWKRRYYL
jgi:hypothetical protein